MSSQRLDAKQVISIVERTNQIANLTDPDALLEQMLDLLVDVTGAEGGTFYVLDPSTDELAARVSQTRLNIQEVIGSRFELDHPSLGAIFADQQNPSLIETTDSNSHWAALLNNHYAHDQLHNLLVIPLCVQGMPTGMIHLYNITNLELSFLQVLGNRIASEVDKATRLQTSTRLNQRLQTLIDIIGYIGSSLDRTQILTMIVNYACELLNAEVSSLFLVDKDSNDMVLEFASSGQDKFFDHIRVPMGMGIIGEAVQTGRPVVIDIISIR